MTHTPLKRVIRTNCFERRKMMKKCLVLMLVLGVASMATAGLTITGTDQGGGNWLVEAVQDFQNATGTGGVFTLTSDAGTQSALYVLGVPTIDMGPPVSNFGWAWSLVGIGAVNTLSAQVTAVPGLVSPPLNGAGTPGLDTPLLTMDPFGAYGYTVTASLIVNGASTVTLGGQWDSVALNQTIDVPEPMTIGLLGLGGLFLRRRK